MILTMSSTDDSICHDVYGGWRKWVDISIDLGMLRQSRIVDGKHVAFGGMDTSIERFGQQCRKSVGDDLEMSIKEYSLADGRDTRQHHSALE
jgi:hypothetical protein